MSCVLVPATYYSLKEKYGDACSHCTYHKYGCPKKESFRFGDSFQQSFIPIEDSPNELPKVKVWCKKCKARNGRIIHEVLWNCRHAYAIKCTVCGSEHLLYKEKVSYEYTGFRNLRGEYVNPDPFHEKDVEIVRRLSQSFNEKYSVPELVASVGDDTGATSTMADALKKAGVI